MIQERYRQDYPGEFVVTSTSWRSGIKDQNREWIPNPIENQHVSGRAAAIGTRVDETRFRHQILQKHRGGLQGKKRLQTYGTGDVWRDMDLNFYASTDNNQVIRLASQDYHDRVPCYTNSRLCLRNPGKFYLVPFQPQVHDLALPLYLAAFDGHNEVYMLGYSLDVQIAKARWMQDVLSVMNTYRRVQFVLVGTETNMPADWRNLDNVTCMTHRQFISHCDV